MKSKNVSLKAIAAQLNVSINTVSHALRDMDDISEELKVKIRRKAIELGYMPNRVAQNIKKDEKPIVAILIISFSNIYFNIFNNELTKLLQEKKEYDYVFFYSKYLGLDIIKQCILQRVDLIVTHVEPSAETYEFAQLNDISIILAGSKHLLHNVDNVSIDNQLGCTLAARYLVNYHTNSKYVFIGNDYFLSQQRYEIFRQELESITDNPQIINFNATKEDVASLYSHIALGYRSLFFYNDILAYQTLDKLDRIAINIRKIYPDLHLVGFDGLCECIYGLKQITTIKIDFKKFAEATYSVIKNRLETPEIDPQQIILPVVIHQRKAY